jgi:glycine cleavage system aminomethyltransferase T
VSVLNNFIKKYKDFSYNNAKAMICLTGYDGILGYRITKNINELNAAKKVVNKLMEEGYYFACHSFGHYHMKKISIENFKKEMFCWQNIIEPIIGKTQIYAYPYGENEILDDNNSVSPKHQMLLDYGFKLFCGVGEKHFFGYYPFNAEKSKQVLFMDRRCLDGLSLRRNSQIYNEFFDCYSVYDKKNRKVSFY